MQELRTAMDLMYSPLVMFFGRMTKKEQEKMANRQTNRQESNHQESNAHEETVNDKTASTLIVPLSSESTKSTTATRPLSPLLPPLSLFPSPLTHDLPPHVHLFTLER